MNKLNPSSNLTRSQKVKSVDRKCTPLMQRSSEEVLLLFICLASIPVLIPYVLLRLFQHNYWQATVDGLVALIMLLTTISVYRTRKTKFLDVIIALFYHFVLIFTIFTDGERLLMWAYPIILGTYFVLKLRTALIINLVSQLAILSILTIVYRTGSYTLLTFNLTLLLISFFAYIFLRQTNLQQLLLSQRAERDPLTGLGNRRAMERKFKVISKLSFQQRYLVSLLIIDIDHFKIVNDTYGHAIGDRILVGVSRHIRTRLRSVDSIFRYGGEEFIVVAKGADLEAAHALAEELRMLIEETDMVEQINVTVSIGVAQLKANEKAEDCMIRADKKLYEAKESGRNCVKVDYDEGDYPKPGEAPIRFDDNDDEASYSSHNHRDNFDKTHVLSKKAG